MIDIESFEGETMVFLLKTSNIHYFDTCLGVWYRRRDTDSSITLLHPSNDGGSTSKQYGANSSESSTVCV